MPVFANNLLSESWLKDEPAPETLHYYGCQCGDCAAAMFAVNANVVIVDPTAAPVQHADAASLPYYVNAVLYPQDWRWNADYAHGTAITVSYSFMSSSPGVYGGFRTFSDADKAGAREALAEWAKVCNITFKEVSSGGQIAFGNADVGGASGMTLWQGTSGASSGWKTTHADVYMSSTMGLGYADGSFGFRAMLHEVGHALGLKHTFDTSGTTMSGIENTAQYSVMSYDNPPSTPNSQPYTPQLYDMAAVQYLYGANKATNAGDTVYQWSNAKASVMTIWDGGGNDTMDGSNQTVNCVLDLRAGQFSSIGVYNGAPAKNDVTIAFGVVIEKAVGGSGNDTIIGNDAANVLVGGSGADRLTGGSGGDAFCYASTAQGGDTITDFATGTDHFEFSARAFGVTSGILASGDFARLSTGYTGANAGNVHFVFDSAGALWFDSNGATSGGMTKMATLTAGSVAASDIHLVGDFTAPTTTPTPTTGEILGTSGNDLLSGAGGDMTMKGGLGNDTYIVDSMGDKVVEYGNQGVDTVQSAFGFILGAYCENLILTGSTAVVGTGSSWHNQITGNDIGNVLSGLAGNDTMNGKGGNDVLVGGSGQDVLTGGSGADQFRYVSTSDGAWIGSNVTKGTIKADTITDFTMGTDKLWFDDAVFKLAAGAAKDGITFTEIATTFNGTNSGASDFMAGKASLVQDSTGTVYYDPNGKGAGYTVIATLQPGAHLHGSDIIIA
ncbi:MAG: M10 family metallopeptidase C-terminal domain-containing protein [Rhodospirillaceae bacterium]|nr:M10 family metallopeptidase C-terminal domain-containing protein [Rhodospirillales bacterium]